MRKRFVYAFAAVLIFAGIHTGNPALVASGVQTAVEAIHSPVQEEQQ